jgi:hypothetical protein
MTFEHRPIRMLMRPLIMLSAILLYLTSAATASAQAPHFGIKPQEAGRAYFEYTLEAGQEVTDVLVAHNASETPLVLNLDVVRGKTMSTGGITFAQDTSGAAQWVTLADAGTVVVPQQSSLELPFRVAIPPGTPPGEYVVGFLATPADGSHQYQLASNTQSNLQVQVVSQVGVALILTVPSASRCETTISSLASTSHNGRWKFGIGLQNTGNMHIKGRGEVVARAASGGEPIVQTPFEIDYFIPGDTIEYPLTVETYPAAGDYQIDVTLLTDCGYAADFSQLVSISRTDVEQAITEAQAEGKPVQVDANAAYLLAQAELVRSLGLLLGGVAALIISATVVVIVLRRRNRNPFYPAGW